MKCADCAVWQYSFNHSYHRGPISGATEMICHEPRIGQVSSSRNTAAGHLSSRPKGAAKAALQRLARGDIPCARCLAVTRLGGSESKK